MSGAPKETAAEVAAALTPAERAVLVRMEDDPAAGPAAWAALHRRGLIHPAAAGRRAADLTPFGAAVREVIFRQAAARHAEGA